MKTDLVLGVSGSLVMRKFNRSGLQVPIRVDRNRRTFQRVWEHRQKNLITNAGMDRIGEAGSFHQLLSYIALGTGSAAPDVTDTSLDNEIARTNTSLGLTADEWAHVGIGHQRFTRGVAFDFAEANGNLTEIAGFQNGSGGSALTRALLDDGSGNPITVTKTSDEQLVVDYAIDVTYGPTSMTPVPGISIAGYGTFDLEHMFYQAYRNVPLTDQLSALRVAGFSTVGANYSSNSGGSAFNDERGQSSSSGGGSGASVAPYDPGSHKLVYTTQLTAGASDMTFAGYGLHAPGPTNGMRFIVCAWRFTDPVELVNNKDYRLKLMAELHWSRA